MRIAVIGGGVSGIAAAHVLKKHGHSVEVFEKSGDIGGVWALAYPGVTLQNTWVQYHYPDFPWPFEPHTNPTGEEIRRYLQLALEHFEIDIRFHHALEALTEEPQGWRVRCGTPEGVYEESFDYVVMAIGQYTEGKHRPEFPGEGDFSGRIMTERDLRDPGEFRDKTVAVVGFGKSAVDMAAIAAPLARQVHHVFRTPRWMNPQRIFGLNNQEFLFNRLSTTMITSWVHPSRFARRLHTRCRWLVQGYWQMIRQVYLWHSHLHPLHFDRERRRRLATYVPPQSVLDDMRSALAVQPRGFYKMVKHGRIQPWHGQLESFTATGLRLQDGREIGADVVVLSLGSETPTFPFMPSPYRELLEQDYDGPQLYRHIIHPDIPRLAFAGYNHGFMHIPAAMIGLHWLCVLLDGDIELPSPEEMKASMDRVQAWKREHIAFEPSRACAVNTRFQHYIDTLLKDLGISPYRKMPNVFAELLAKYGAGDYRDIMAEYKRPDTPRRPLPLDT